MSLNEFINNRRKELNMSIDELVLKSGIPKGTLSKITAGINTNPTLGTVEALCRALNCSINDAVGFVTESDNITSAERELIKKYRALDKHGKNMVDFVINEEYSRLFSSENTTTIFRAAKSTDNHPPEIGETTKDFSKIPPTTKKL